MSNQLGSLPGISASTMPLRPLIDLSIDQTLGRTAVTSITVALSILPLALIGVEVMRGFALAIIFGCVRSTLVQRRAGEPDVKPH